ncbi:MAG: globin family protein [Oricola sp.]
MTPNEIDLVQASFAKVAPISAAAAELFYGRLFDIAPEVRPLFTTPLDEQGRKLMMTLAVVVNGLRNLGDILPTASALAVRHVGYGVKAEHYAPVGEALIWTLEQGLGDAFTEEVRQAWLSAYTALSGAMLAAAYPKIQAAE